MLYQIKNGTVSLGGETILSHIEFEIKGKEKIAIVGRNGAGKTTLLRLIYQSLSGNRAGAEEVVLDRDDKQMGKHILTSRKLVVGMLTQTVSSLDQEKTVEELLLKNCPEKETYSKERFLYEMEYDRIFTGFGFEKEQKKRKLSSFSGGEQTKISLIQLLLLKPDILLLDEPTNHLDIPTVEWLETYMREYDHAVVFVSHDRFFLDQVVEVVYEVNNKRLKRYPGNYSHYKEQRHKDLQIQKKAYEKQQAEAERLTQLIEKFKHKPKKAAFARSRKTILDRMERMEKPEAEQDDLFTGNLEPQFPGNKWVYEAEHLQIGYEKVLLELSLRVRRGQKIGIIGDNGVGKSTFLKTVAGELPPKGGKGKMGEHILFGYFDQQSAQLSSPKSVADHFHDLFPGMTEKEVRQILGAYLFGGRDAMKNVDALSGGEKARLLLAELLTSRPNFLILDEPTNHMDIAAKERLEAAFQSYTGTMLFVSHDRYFIQQVADAILVFEDNRVMYYPFGYDHYLKRSRQGEGQQLAAMIQAEEQALIADFHAVPKAERHRLREISTASAYEDWQLRLAGEPLEQAADHAKKCWENLQCLPNTLSAEAASEDWWKEKEKAQDEFERANEDWTEACMTWLNTYEEIFPEAFAGNDLANDSDGFSDSVLNEFSAETKMEVSFKDGV